MATFNKAFELLKGIEFSNPENALHYNVGERGYTFMGIYAPYHANSLIWKRLDYYANCLNYKQPYTKIQLKILSLILYNDKEVIEEVKKIYKKEYWDKIKGDLIKAQKIADEIFIFAINTNPKKAIKKAQEIVGVKIDGIIGKQTLQALNNFDEKLFDKLYDEKEISFYKKLASIKPKFKRFLKGWINRAYKV